MLNLKDFELRLRSLEDKVEALTAKNKIQKGYMKLYKVNSKQEVDGLKNRISELENLFLSKQSENAASVSLLASPSLRAASMIQGTAKSYDEIDDQNAYDQPHTSPKVVSTPISDKHKGGSTPNGNTKGLDTLVEVAVIPVHQKRKSEAGKENVKKTEKPDPLVKSVIRPPNKKLKIEAKSAKTLSNPLPSSTEVASDSPRKEKAKIQNEIESVENESTTPPIAAEVVKEKVKTAQAEKEIRANTSDAPEVTGKSNTDSQNNGKSKSDKRKKEGSSSESDSDDSDSSGDSGDPSPPYKPRPGFTTKPRWLYEEHLQIGKGNGTTPKQKKAGSVGGEVSQKLPTKKGKAGF